jgi:hypothetical protein
MSRTLPLIRIPHIRGRGFASFTMPACCGGCVQTIEFRQLWGHDVDPCEVVTYMSEIANRDDLPCSDHQLDNVSFRRCPADHECRAAVDDRCPSGPVWRIGVLA